MKLPFTFILIFTVLFCHAQKPIKEKAQNYYYYKKDGRTAVSTADSAEIIQVITEPDSGSELYGVQEFYKNKKLKFTGQSSDVHPVRLEGQSISYYPNGRKNLIAFYKSNRAKGDSYQYYPNGKPYIVMSYFFRDSINHSMADSSFKSAYDSTGKAILEKGNGYFKRYNGDFNKIIEQGQVKDGKQQGEWKGYNSYIRVSFIEKYTNGKLIEGNSVDSVGTRYSYNVRNKPAEYKTGITGFGRLLSTNVVYPRQSREAGHQGKVVYQFVISPEGKPRGFKLLTSLDRYADAEALRVLELMPNWIPGEYYGKRTSTSYSVPISFVFQGR